MSGFFDTRLGVVIPHTYTVDWEGDVEMTDAPDIDASPPHQPVAAPLHLLKLPREIRNRIYEFLSHEIELRTIKKIGGVRTVVHITNAPCVEVLLTSSRLHDEYLESQCFRNLSAVVLRVDQWKKWIKWPSTAHLKYRDIEALLRVKNITFRCIYGREGRNAKGPIDMIDALLAKGTTLHTVRLIEESLTEQGYMEQTPGEEPTYTNSLVASKVHHNTPMTGQIHGLPIRQCGHGTRREVRYRNERYEYHGFVIDVGVFSSKSVSSAKLRAKEVAWAEGMDIRPWAWDEVRKASTASTAPAGSAALVVTNKWAEGHFGWNDNTESETWEARLQDLSKRDS
jgi:hypothetical protein